MADTKYVLVHKRSGQSEDVTNTVVGDGFTTIFTPTISVRFEHVDGGLVNDDYSITADGEAVAEPIVPPAPEAEIPEVPEAAVPEAPEFAPVDSPETTIGVDVALEGADVSVEATVPSEAVAGNGVAPEVTA